MNPVVKIKELSVANNGDLTLEGVEIDVSEKTLMGLVAAFAKKALINAEEEQKPKVFSDTTTAAATAPKADIKTYGAFCPECEADIKLETGTIKSEIMQCNDCGAELEVESVNPPVLVAAPEESEDWGE